MEDDLIDKDETLSTRFDIRWLTLMELVGVWIWCDKSNLDGIMKIEEEKINDKGQRAKEARNKYPAATSLSHHLSAATHTYHHNQDKFHTASLRMTAHHAYSPPSSLHIFFLADTRERERHFPIHTTYPSPLL